MKSLCRIYRRSLFVFFIGISVALSSDAVAQSITIFQNIIGGGTTNGTAANGKVQVAGVAGQPLVNSSSVSGFYTVSYLLTVEIDNIPPIISLTFGNQAPKGTVQGLSPVITDNYFNQISEAKVFFRPIGSKDFTPRDLTKAGSTTTYSTNLEADKFDAMGVEFYMTAKDMNNNSQRYPPDGGLYIYTVDKAIVPSSLLSFGDQKKNYRMVSVPYTFNENVSTLLEEFGTNDNTKWRLITYTGNNTYAEYPSDFTTLQRAKGYWFIARESNELTLGESVQAPANNQTELYEMTLQPEWNQVGNPYTLPISWENVRSFNPQLTVGKLKIYDGSASEPYKNGDDLLAFQGGFVYFDGASSAKIKIPFKGQTLGGRKGEITSPSGWQLPINISSGDITNRMGGIGMHPMALVTKDRFDDHNPPPFLDFVEINFNHPEHPLKSFCYDVVPELEEYVWTFTTAASVSESVRLNWDNSKVPPGKDLYLYDEFEGKVVDMIAEDNYVSDKNRTLKIYYGTDIKERIRPEVVRLSRAYPNPFYDEVNLSLALPGEHEIYQVSIDVFNAQGQKVKTIRQGIFNSGIHEAKWNGMDEELQKCAAGLYLYKVRISNNGKDQMLTERILLAK